MYFMMNLLCIENNVFCNMLLHIDLLDQNNVSLSLLIIFIQSYLILTLLYLSNTIAKVLSRANYNIPRLFCVQLCKTWTPIVPTVGLHHLNFR
jgi:hypothetical protein